MKAKMWIARDEDYWDLNLFYEKPTSEEGVWDTNKICYPIDPNEFPEVTFENSPQEIEIELKLINNGK